MCSTLERCQVVDMRVAVVELAVVRLHFPVMARAGAIEFGVEKARRGKDIGVAIVVQPPGLHVADVHGPLGNEESLVIEAGASIQLGILLVISPNGCGWKNRPRTGPFTMN